ncbi:MAG: class I SAM-dependent methyltransferase [Solidesulfovibrio sp. DCME]|uniref:class I SAM-dependent methyltransferase n=1 Tax=Solidesulfovibrio sp. DCME TaxID=3447380 RepID=UPI003D12CFD7
MAIHNIDDKHLQELYRTVDRNPCVRLFQNIKYRFILPLPADKTAGLIDVGCGRGRFLLDMARRGYSDLSGLDIDNALYPEAANRVVFYRNSLCSPGLDVGRRYPYVFVQGVLHHLPVTDLDEAARNLARLCAPGGSLYIYEPNMATPIGHFFYYTFLRLFPPMYRNALAEKDEQRAFCQAWDRFIRVLENQGFRPRRHSNWSFYKCYIATRDPAVALSASNAGHTRNRAS